MIRLAITAEAFEAISATLPLGSVGYEHERTASGGYFVRLEPSVESKLERLQGRGEDISEVIMRFGDGNVALA